MCQHHVIRTKEKSIQLAGNNFVVDVGPWPVILKTNGVKF